MKVNVVLSLISIALACLIGYLAYTVAEGQKNDIAYAIGSTICFIGTLIPIIGLHYESSRLGVNIRAASVLFFIIFLISHFCFAYFGVKMPYYIIVNGIILIVYLAIFYKMNQLKDI